jgi:hypothetical protein
MQELFVSLMPLQLCQLFDLELVVYSVFTAVENFVGCTQIFG